MQIKQKEKSKVKKETRDGVGGTASLFKKDNKKE